MDIVTRTEAMAMLKVGHTKLWEMVRDGKITAIKRDGRTYFDKADLDAYWTSLKTVKTTSFCDTYRKKRLKTTQLMNPRPV